MRRATITRKGIPASALAAAVLLALAFAAPVLAEDEAPAPGAHYFLSYAAAGSTRFEIRIDLDEPLAGPAVFAFPNAVPMGYVELQYDRFVSDVRAFGPASNALQVERLDGPRFRIGRAGQQVASVRYDVNPNWMENEIRDPSHSSKLRTGYAGILGYSVFGYLEGREDRPARLTVSGPAGWSVFGTLDPAETPPAEPFSAAAADFYALADSQIVMGRDLTVRRLNTRVPLYVVLHSEAVADVDLIGQLGGQALNAIIDYFGDAPFEHYTLFVEFLKPRSAEHRPGAALEHLESTTYFVDQRRVIGPGSSPERMREALYDLAHPIARSWIPKRCAGKGYFPFDWELAPVLDSLWLAEGFSRYVAAVAVGGTMGTSLESLVDERFRDVLADASPSIRRLSTVELSHAASTHAGADSRPGRDCLARGGMMAAEMDARIREATSRAKTLRDGLRGLVAWCEEKNERTFRIDDLPALIQAGSGVDVRPVFDKWIAPQSRP